MASFVPLKCSCIFRLNTGTDPVTGKAILKIVSLRAMDPDITADNMKTCTDLLKPFFAHPAIAVEKSAADLLEA